jgi:drug/metabolite transporter (DMT)-like permease
MLAFAANSLLCRAALDAGHADAASFTALRLVSGALVLLALARMRAAAPPPARGAWASGTALFAYAILFSLAYLRIPAGTGALLLFAAVQLTMIGAGLRAGERPRPLEWTGLALSLLGLTLLARPGWQRPDPAGVALMLAAGVAWGVYTLRGRGAADAIAANAAGFARAAALSLAASGLAGLAAASGIGASAPAAPHVSAAGLALAVASGSVTSGLGYALWYAALRGLSASRAAVVQLSVPPLAALLGVLILDERLTERVAFSSLLILGGIGLALGSRTAAGHIARNAQTEQ